MFISAKHYFRVDNLTTYDTKWVNKNSATPVCITEGKVNDHTPTQRYNTVKLAQYYLLEL